VLLHTERGVTFKSIIWTSTFPTQELKHSRNVFYFCPDKWWMFLPCLHPHSLEHCIT